MYNNNIVVQLSRQKSKLFVINYIMFYRVDEEKQIIYIMRFIYGRRDYINLL
jgi:hypothetical protein